MLRSSLSNFVGGCFVFAAALVLGSCSHKAPSSAGGGAPSIQIDVLVIQPDSFSFTTDAVGNILAQEFVETVNFGIRSSQAGVVDFALGGLQIANGIQRGVGPGDPGCNRSELSRRQ